MPCSVRAFAGDSTITRSCMPLMRAAPRPRLLAAAAVAVPAFARGFFAVAAAVLAFVARAFGVAALEAAVVAFAARAFGAFVGAVVVALAARGFVVVVVSVSSDF